MRVLILKAGGADAAVRAHLDGTDFEDWFRQGLSLEAAQAPAVHAHLGQPLPLAPAPPAVVVTGSAAMVTEEAPWGIAAEHWLRTLVMRGVPVLGVCFGHQLLARALGGTVARNATGREIGTVQVSLTTAGRNDPLFADLPDRLVVQSAHEQAVTALPPGARLLASNAATPHQAFAYGDRAWGVQFHPEFGAAVVRSYAATIAGRLRSEGIDPDAVTRDARDSEHGGAILRRFLALTGCH